MRTVITLDNPAGTEWLSGHLRMGGVSPSGEEINVNSHCLIRNGKPWLPVMGEFHFSRYPSQYWEEELLKMKAGGIGVVATYVFWIHHEEKEGRFRWDGDRDLRRFVMLCGKLGLETVVRIGPWAHGECRNGGFPDWLHGRCAPRTNDEDYLVYVRRLYAEIAAQLQGLAFQDGGPLIGLQFDNELTDNAAHLQRLKEIALEEGMRAPLYTVTGWGGPGGAAIPKDEVLPLFGGYPDHPWERHTEKLAPGPHYFFHAVRNDPGIGSDMLQAVEGIAGDLAHIDRYPNGTCELGSGVQHTYHRRPVITADDIGAMATVRIANGCNLLGYYMYHGGTHPAGELTTMQESSAHGNQLPVHSYDFQAPIGEYGFLRDSYRLLKRLHLFIQDYGSSLAPMNTVFPGHRPSSLSDTETLRVAARAKDGAGYVFFNNYQRLTEMGVKDGAGVELHLPEERLIVPEGDGCELKDGAYFFWPFNLNMEGVLLKYATAQPLCVLRGEHETVFVFFEAGGVRPRYVFDSGTVKLIEANKATVRREGQVMTVSALHPGIASMFTLQAEDGKAIKLLTLTERQSRHAWRGLAFGQERLVLCESGILFSPDGEELRIFGQDPELAAFSIYPPVERSLTCGSVPLPAEEESAFRTYRPQPGRHAVKAVYRAVRNSELNDELFPYLFEEKGQEGQSPEWEIIVDVSALHDGAQDIALTIDYVGDVAQLYIGGRCVADRFYDGVPWRIGLKRYREELELGPIILKISPLLKERAIYLESRPSADRMAEVRSIKAEAEFILAIRSEA
ncbi:beta-galactosidase [Paenibacillus sp. J5C_2022]|uniref:beta-galactosidase n=1 Tax=Paenibacillus sp. J5C2022 TaxID=2977129 RepID=UPI0021D1BB84|nr:beta-galactosidase [Paenibacillus sp. J5C2022]MCU6707765.1 beta-galactosidase [Paenibacillus sp. J5C2022]